MRRRFCFSKNVGLCLPVSGCRLTSITVVTSLLSHLYPTVLSDTSRDFPQPPAHFRNRDTNSSFSNSPTVWLPRSRSFSTFKASNSNFHTKTHHRNPGKSSRSTLFQECPVLLHSGALSAMPRLEYPAPTSASISLSSSQWNSLLGHGICRS
ncbi:hypothetical protein BDV06DRAFT_183937 [Aspergillus oleicola]